MSGRLVKHIQMRLKYTRFKGVRLKKHLSTKAKQKLSVACFRSKNLRDTFAFNLFNLSSTPQDYDVTFRVLSFCSIK
jgi:hypothetical protein